MKLKTKTIVLFLLLFFIFIQCFPASHSQFEDQKGKAVYFVNLDIIGINDNNEKGMTIRDNVGGIDLKYGSSPLFYIDSVDDYGQVWITPNISRYAQILKLKTTYYLETIDDPSEFYGNLLSYKMYSLRVILEGNSLSKVTTGLWTDVWSITFDGTNSVTKVENLTDAIDKGKLNFEITINKNLLLPAFLNKSNEHNTSEGTFTPKNINIFPLFAVAGNTNFSYVDNKSFTFTQTASTIPTITDRKSKTEGGHSWFGQYRQDLSYPIISQNGAVAELAPVGSDIDLYTDVDKTTKTIDCFNGDYFSVEHTLQKVFFDVDYRIKPEYKFVGYHHVTSWQYALFWGGIFVGITSGTDSVNTINRLYINNVAKQQTIYLYLLITSDYSFKPKAVLTDTMLPPTEQLPSADVTNDIIDVTTSGSQAGSAYRVSIFDILYQFLWIIITIIIIVAVVAVLIFLIKTKMFKKIKIKTTTKTTSKKFKNKVKIITILTIATIVIISSIIIIFNLI